MSHIVIDRRFGFIRESAVTSASLPEGRILPQSVRSDNTSSRVWADSAYPSRKNETRLASKMLVSRIHRRKSSGKAMQLSIARAYAAKSSTRARIEDVFANRKNRFVLFIRTIGLARAEAELALGQHRLRFRPPDFPRTGPPHGLSPSEIRKTARKTAPSLWRRDD
jgi:IS5 family transposase